MRLVLASNNAKKLLELQALLGGLAIELVNQGSLGIAEAEEPHASFVENALAKARHAAQASGGPALADDSGLCVDVLGGLPGVNSAHIAALARVAPDREAHRRQQDAANNDWLLKQLHDKPSPGERRAHYLCVLVALRHAEDPEPLIAEGRWRGQVLLAPAGDGGFGYDPLMQMDGCEGSVANMDVSDKNRQSHRALAAQQLCGLWLQRWGLSDG